MPAPCPQLASFLDYIYRVGKPSEKKKHRDTIIKFRKKATRDNFYQSRRNIIQREDQNQVYINDHLTEHRANVFFAARMVKAKQIHSTWSQRGNILIRKFADGQPKHIRTHKQLREFAPLDDKIEDDRKSALIRTDLDTSDEDD